MENKTGHTRSVLQVDYDQYLSEILMQGLQDPHGPSSIDKYSLIKRKAEISEICQRRTGTVCLRVPIEIYAKSQIQEML